MPTGFRTAVAEGDKFGRLTVVCEAPSRHNRPTTDRPNGGGRTRMIRCRCECGRESNYRLSNLTRGVTTACRQCGWRQRWVHPSLEDRAALLGCTVQELQLEIAWAAGLFEGEGTFTVSNPLGIACIDIRSYTNGLIGQAGYYNLARGGLLSMTGEIGTSDLRDHVALDDAIGQGRLFMALLAHAQRLQDARGKRPSLREGAAS